MCALQMQAEAGPTILESPEGLEPYLEKFVVKQVPLIYDTSCTRTAILMLGRHVQLHHGAAETHQRMVEHTYHHTVIALSCCHTC